MNIDNLSFLTEITNEDASHVNGGYIDYWSIANSTAGSFEFIGDSLNSLGLDGSSWYAAALTYYTW